MNASDDIEPEIVFADWLEEVEAGKAPPIEELLAAHPHHAGALGRLHADWQYFAPILEHVIPGQVLDSADVSGADSLAPGSASPADTAAWEELGLRIPDAGRYRFREVLGQGGGGVVLRVWDRKLHRSLAMKVVLGPGERVHGAQTTPIDPRALSRFVDEARISSQLEHPSIVPVHELGTDSTGRAFFTMRLVRGEDLATVFGHVRADRNDWTQTRVLGVLVRACEALSYAHERGVLHRDLKPSNIMVGRHGEVHVLDWGLARDVREAAAPPNSEREVRTVRGELREQTPGSSLLTGHGAVVGTPAYMAPEQAAGDLDRVGPRSDVYAVGAILYELLAGSPPFVPPGTRVDPGQILMRLLEGPPAPLEGVASNAPGELVAICERAMERDPDQRYGTIAELEADLRAFLERRVVSAFESGPWAETRRWIQRHPRLAGATLSTMLALAGAAYAALHFGLLARDRAIAGESRLYTSAVVGARLGLSSRDYQEMRRRLDEAPEHLRSVEWEVLDALADTSLVAYSGHEEFVRSARFDPNGGRIVTASDDGTARIWERDTGDCLHVLDMNSDGVMDARFDPTGDLVAARTGEGHVWLWDASAGSLVGELRLETSEAPEDRTNTLEIAFAEGGATLLATWRGHVEVWDIASRQLRHSFTVEKPEEGTDSAVAVDPDGSLVAVATPDGRVHVREAVTGAVVGHWPTGLEGGIRLEFSLDGQRLSAGTTDERASEAVVLDPLTGATVKRLEQQVAGRCLSANGALVLVTDRSTAGVMELGNDKPAWSLALRDNALIVDDLWLHPDGSMALERWGVDCHLTLHRHDGHSWPLRGVEDWVQSIEPSPDHRFVLTSQSSGTTRLWDAQSDNGWIELAGGITTCAGGRAAERIVSFDAGGELRIWDARTLERLADVQLNGIEPPPQVSYRSVSCVHSSASDLAAVLYEDSRLFVVDTVLARVVGILQLEARPTGLLQPGPSPGTALVQVEGGDWLELDLEARSILRRSPYRISPDEHPALADPSAVLAPDGSWVAVPSYADIEERGPIRIEDPRGNLLCELLGHRGVASQLHATADSTRLISTGDDWTVRIWDVRRGIELLRFGQEQLGKQMQSLEDFALFESAQMILNRQGVLGARGFSLVPASQRHRWRCEGEAVRQDAARWVASARASGAGWRTVVEQARTDGSLVGALQREVFNQITREAAGTDEK